MASALALVLIAAAALPARGQAAPDHWLVWVWHGGGAVTYDIAAAARGHRVIRRRPGIRIALEDEEVELRVRERRVDAIVCTAEYGFARDPNRSLAVHRLEAVRDGTVRTVIAEPDGRGVPVSDELEVVATVGPLAITRRAMELEDPCAAHGSYSTIYTWIDLRDGAEQDVVTRFPPAPELVEQARAALLAQYERRVRDGGEWWPDDEDRDLRVMVGEHLMTAAEAEAQHRARVARRDGRFVGADAAIPRFDGSRWSLAYRISMGVAYAWSGPDHAYAITLELQTHDSGPLEGGAMAPRIVSRFLARMPRARLGGFSRMQ